MISQTLASDCFRVGVRTKTLTPEMFAVHENLHIVGERHDPSA